MVLPWCLPTLGAITLDVVWALLLSHPRNKYVIYTHVIIVPGACPRVYPKALVVTLEHQCGVPWCQVRFEVFDLEMFFVTFCGDGDHSRHSPSPNICIEVTLSYIYAIGIRASSSTSLFLLHRSFVLCYLALSPTSLSSFFVDTMSSHNKVMYLWGNIEGSRNFRCVLSIHNHTIKKNLCSRYKEREIMYMMHINPR